MSLIINGLLTLIAGLIGLYVTGSSFFYILIVLGIVVGILPLLVILVTFAVVSICYALDV